MAEISESSTYKIKRKFDLSLCLFGLGILILDQLTKAFVNFYLPTHSAYLPYSYEGIEIIKNFYGIQFSIDHMTNSGAAWGMLSQYPLFLIFLRMGLITALMLYLFYFKTNAALRLPLILILSGAIGNVLDFFLYRHVIDIFHFVIWRFDCPVFNVADASISIGIAWLFYLSWCKPCHD